MEDQRRHEGWSPWSVRHRWVACRHGENPSLASFVGHSADPSSSQGRQDGSVALIGAGGEGIVVKPLAGDVRGQRGLVQPGVKVRGREYLRITYGPRLHPA